MTNVWIRALRQIWRQSARRREVWLDLEGLAVARRLLGGGVGSLMVGVHVIDHLVIADPDALVKVHPTLLTHILVEVEGPHLGLRSVPLLLLGLAIRVPIVRGSRINGPLDLELTSLDRREALRVLQRAAGVPVARRVHDVSWASLPFISFLFELLGQLFPLKVGVRRAGLDIGPRQDLALQRAPLQLLQLCMPAPLVLAGASKALHRRQRLVRRLLLPLAARLGLLRWRRSSVRVRSAFLVILQPFEEGRPLRISLSVERKTCISLIN